MILKLSVKIPPIGNKFLVDYEMRHQFQRSLVLGGDKTRNCVKSLVNNHGFLLPTKFYREREFIKDPIWSQLEALDLLYVFCKYLVDVWLTRIEKAIRVQSRFHQKFLVYQITS
jgi:hypothetical protein